MKKLQLAATRKSVDSQKPDMNKQVAALQQQLNTAVRERNRVMNLLKEDAANRKQLDDWEAQITLLEKQIDAQRSTLDNSLGSLTEQSSSVSIQIAQIEDQLQKCHVVSPITGTVLAKYAEAGELMAVGKPLFKVADLEKVYIRAYITSAQLEKVKLGQKAKVYAETGLRVSVGVAPNKFLAKLASDLEKPDGLVLIKHETAAAFIAPMPVRKIFGIGKAA